MQTLNIAVAEPLQEQWRRWLTPDPQPFFLTAAEGAALDLPTRPRAERGWSAQEGDTFTVWNVPAEADRVVWLSHEQWQTLAPGVQRQLLRLQVKYGRGNVPLGRHFSDLLPGLPVGRFLWSPEQLTPEVLARIVEQEGTPCQRDRVPPEIWAAAAGVLPRVRELAGTFSLGLGNCFGAVMGAAGVVGAEDEWTQREPFEQFLRKRAVRGGQDADAGTVLVWRSGRGVEHAAVTLGGGWAFQKAAQTWWTPRVVLPVAAVKQGNRTPGWKLERWRLRPAAESKG